MTFLSVNIDHIATIREARRTNEPDPVTAAAICELAGAHGITIHLRGDRRHIQDRDVKILRQTVKTKLNIEMANRGDDRYCPERRAGSGDAGAGASGRNYNNG